MVRGKDLYTVVLPLFVFSLAVTIYKGFEENNLRFVVMALGAVAFLIGMWIWGGRNKFIIINIYVNSWSFLCHYMVFNNFTFCSRNLYFLYNYYFDRCIYL